MLGINIIRLALKTGVKALAGKCPEWIFDITCSRVCIQFLSESHPLELSSRMFCEQLSRNYNPVDLKFLNQFIYYRLNYESNTKIRNLKPLFGNVEDGVAEAKHNMSMKRFKAYVFGLRSNNSPTPPPGWDVIKNTDNLPLIRELVSTCINPLDLI